MGSQRRREGVVLGMNLGRPIVTKWDFVAYLCESDTLFPNDFGEDLLLLLLLLLNCRP